MSAGLPTAVSASTVPATPVVTAVSSQSWTIGPSTSGMAGTTNSLPSFLTSVRNAVPTYSSPAQSNDADTLETSQEVDQLSLGADDLPAKFSLSGFIEHSGWPTAEMFPSEQPDRVFIAWDGGRASVPGCEARSVRSLTQLLDWLRRGRCFKTAR